MHFCGPHPYGTTISYVTDANDVAEKKCFCKKNSANELCQFCIAIRYSLNFACHKICLEKLPDFMLPRVKALNKYWKELNCDPFFYFENDGIEISLDNPKMEKITVATDHRLFLSRS